MSAFKYKVIVKGKVYGEATTKAEAEAVAKKIGGTVAEVVGAKPAAKKPKVAKKQSGGDEIFSATTLEHARKLRHRLGIRRKATNPALYLSREPKVSIAGAHGRMAVAKFADPYVGNEFINGLMFVDYDPETLRIAGRQRIATAKGKDTADYAALWPDAASLLRESAGNINASIVEGKKANPKNPPLEAKNAAALLDAVKPGKPQVIHGVKVARVGAGYSIDRMVLSRELAIKRLEGGKVGNPKPNPKAVKAKANPKTVKAKAAPKAKPKAKPAAKPKRPAKTPIVYI